MSRLTDNDKHWGPFTYGPWTDTFSIRWISSYDDGSEGHNHFRVIAFGRVVQLRLPNILKPFGERYNYFPREYGFSLSDMGNGYDFLQVFFGPQTHDSLTTKSWSKHLPWKQWNHVRRSIYNPDGTLFATEEPKKWEEFSEKKDQCPKSYFGFEDYEGEMIIATCTIEEREWHKGEGWFKWLKYFSKPKIIRSLDLWFSAEVGRGKGSWKGGTLGHSIEMLPGETPQQAFERYCAKGHKHKGDTTGLRFIGPCNPPPPKPPRVERQSPLLLACGYDSDAKIS